MKFIGVTGSIASGKSTLCKKFKKLGFSIYSCDVINKELMKSDFVISLLSKTFGSDILENNQVSHKRLREIVFNDNSELQKLESIMHPLIIDEIIKIKNNSQNEQIVFVEVPLLFETKMENIFDYTIVVYVDYETQIQRLMNRDDVKFPEAIKLINKQMSLDEKAKIADFIIDNSHQEFDMIYQAKNLIKKLLEE